ncbi:hypothetical protein [Uliginosibacterium sp. TH139]|uniref:hypothetical protein n=1 Tax=Uliginosibacterium sp. TH139 TaxID=2067453 RepID=UPI000C7E6ECE|nr:hypothetical protein [Uliginosibacterium sp. TH139]PLK50722.1 hypothetical protein C0V76_02615 [Uliginosibacterium sp. TH139]
MIRYKLLRTPAPSLIASWVLIALTACGGGGGATSNNSSSAAASSSANSVYAPIYDYASGGQLSLLTGSLGGYGYYNGVGTSARFDEATGIARDATTGDLFVTDRFNNLIRKVSATGTVSTYAGMLGSHNGADGPISSASFGYPSGIAMSNTGILYVADEGADTIRKISGGVVSTLAGSTNVSGSADGSGSSARFHSPRSLAVDSNGNVFVADLGNHTVRKISSGGLVSTPAGSAGLVGSTDGSGNSARFSYPTAIAVDASNNVYIGDTNGVRKMTAAGAVTTVMSDSTLSAAGCGGTITGLAIDSGSNLYISYYQRICKLSSGGTASLLAGNSESAVIDGIGSAASVYTQGMVIDATGGALYLADAYAVRTLNTSSASVTTLAGKGPYVGYLDGATSNARFRQPRGMVADASGNLYVADSGNYLLRKISSSGIVSTLAGSAGLWGNTDGSGSAARLGSIGAVARDSAGNLYLMDSCALRKVTAAGVVTTLAGLASTCSTLDGTGTAARFSHSDALTLDPSGNIFVAEYSTNVIRKVSPTGVVTTFAGSADFPGSSDGSGTAARFAYPESIVSDSSGNLYVADTGNHAIRKITPAGLVSTYAGSATTAGYVDGNLGSSLFVAPRALTFDSSGNLYVVDSNTVRKISTTGSVSTVLGKMDELSVVVTGSLPGHLNRPYDIAVIGKKLYITDENGILVADIP